MSGSGRLRSSLSLQPIGKNGIGRLGFPNTKHSQGGGCFRASLSLLRHARGPAPLNSIARHGFCSSRALSSPLRVALVGSGPAGFYSARRLMQRVDHAHVDMYEQLPVPFGLVRFGVAPDHPEVKNCVETFAEVARSPRFRFLGNVQVGKDIPLAELRQAYDAVVFAYGAAQDRKLGIAGEEKLGGIYSARAFVGWYNGLPEYQNLNPNLQAGDTAVIIGQGNVALDVARILLSDPSRLGRTDISSTALAALGKSRVRQVRIVGRRGPMQAAFTIKEVRELLQMSDVNFEPLAAGVMPSDTKSLPRAKRRLAELILKHSCVASPGQSSATSRSWSLDFMRSPSAFLSSAENPHQLSAVEFGHTQFTDDVGNRYSPSATVTTSDTTSILGANLAFRSIGYKSVAVPGMEDLGINFDSRLGIIPNIAGRVITSSGEHIDGLYCTGWVKNGPTGVIATTMEDAFATSEAIVEDFSAGAIMPSTNREGWQQIRGAVSSRPVSWEDWLKIDTEERRMGAAIGKEREKFRSTAEMLRILT